MGSYLSVSMMQKPCLRPTTRSPHSAVSQYKAPAVNTLMQESSQARERQFPSFQQLAEMGFLGSIRKPACRPYPYIGVRLSTATSVEEGGSKETELANHLMSFLSQ